MKELLLLFSFFSSLFQSQLLDRSQEITKTYFRKIIRQRNRISIER